MQERVVLQSAAGGGVVGSGGGSVGVLAVTQHWMSESPGQGHGGLVPGWKSPSQPLLLTLRQKPVPAGTVQESSTQH